MVITVSHSYRRVRKERLTLKPAGLNVEMQCGIDVSVLLDLDTVQLWNYRRARGFPTRHRTTNNEKYKQCRTAFHSHQLSESKVSSDSDRTLPVDDTVVINRVG